MFCPACGKEKAEAEKKCSACGYEFEPEKNEAPAQKTEENTALDTDNTVAENEAAPEAVAVAEEPCVEAEGGEIRFAADEPVKKKSKLPVVLSIIICAALLIGGALFFFWDEISLLWATPEEHFEYDTKEAVSALADNVSEAYGDMLEGITEDSAYSGELVLEISEELTDIIGFDIPSNVGITYDLTFNEAKIGVDLAVMAEGQEFISGNAIIDLNDMALYFSVPDILDETFVLELSDFLPIDNLDNLSSGMGTFGGFDIMSLAGELVEFLPDEDMVAELIENYLGAAIEAIRDVSCDENATLEVLGTEQKGLTKYEVTITPEMMADIIFAVIEEFFDDDIIRDYISELCENLEEFVGVPALFNAEKIEGEIDKALKELESSYNKMKKEMRAEMENNVATSLDVALWMDDDSSIVGLSLETDILFATFIDDEVVESNSEKLSFFCAKAESKNKAAYEISVNKGGGELFFIGGSGDEKNGKFTGEWSVRAEGEELIVLEFEEFNFSDMINGKVRFGITESIYAEISGVNNDKESTITVSIGMGGKPLGSVTVGAKSAKVKEIEIPKDAVDVADIGEYITDISLFDLADILEESGIDISELMSAAEVLAEFFGDYIPDAEGLYGDFEYDYDEEDYEELFDDFEFEFDEEDYEELFDDLMEENGEYFEDNEDLYEELFESLF